MSRSRVSAVLGAVILCILAGDSAALARRQAHPALPVSVAVERHLLTESPAAATRRAEARDRAVRDLFDKRADAVRRRDRAAFLALVDPAAKEFRGEQATVFESLGKLDLAAWSYEQRTAESYSPGSIDWARYGDADDLWLPVLVLRYQLKGYDERPIARRVVYTVVRRGSRWYIANDADLEATTSSGTSVRIDPWEGGPIVVKKTRHGLVIGHTDDAAAIDGIAREVESAVAHVSSYVGKGWGEKVVIVLPRSQDELEHLLENPDVPFEFAAIAKPQYAELRGDPGRRLAGERVVINPKNFRPGDATNRMLIRHELTHVALVKRTGPLSPTWLVEGVAEYVGNAGSLIADDRIGGELRDLVDKSGPPAHLPSDSDFGLIADAGPAYNEAWLACRYIALRWGRAALLRLYDRMGDLNGADHPGTKLATELRRVLRTDEAALVSGWRPYVRASVGDLAKVLVSPGPRYREEDRGAIDVADLARQKSLRAGDLVSMGLVRAAEGFWSLGSVDDPTRIVAETIVTGRDETAAAALERTLGGRYAKFDSSPTTIPHGRLYLVGVRIGNREYDQPVAIVRAGTLVVEVRVAVPRFADGRAEARALAASVYARAVA
ncbi:MAG TPA: hypothetical protein VFQ85_01095 [Mycobacteriales bacterium]|jgi:hypothetical protein|nr:hypothetical protein [Mycobacteriales bacterium]